MICRDCQAGRTLWGYNAPCVYIMYAPGMYKVGHSYAASQRAEFIRNTEKIRDVQVIRAYAGNHDGHIEAAEKRAHQILDRKRLGIDGEWYVGELRVIIRAVQRGLRETRGSGIKQQKCFYCWKMFPARDDLITVYAEPFAEPPMTARPRCQFEGSLRTHFNIYA